MATGIWRGGARSAAMQLGLLNRSRILVGARLCALYDKLGLVMQAIDHTNPTCQRDIVRIARMEYSKGRLRTGRHMCYVVVPTAQSQ